MIEPGAPPPPGRIEPGRPDLASRFAAFAAEARADDAARSRARQHWLRQAASEEGTVRGALVDLAERATPVLLTTVAGRSHRGTIRAVGRDFVLVGADRGQHADAVVAVAAVSSVRTADTAPTGDRAVDVDVTVAEALVELAADRPEIVLVTHQGELVAGQLRSVGRDVATVAVPGPGRPRALVPVAAIAELALA